jgi:hypothetical protein
LYSEPSIHSFYQGSWKSMMAMGNSRCGGQYKIEFVQGPQKLNEGSRRAIHSGMIVQGFTV